MKWPLLHRRQQLRKPPRRHSVTLGRSCRCQRRRRACSSGRRHAAEPRSEKQRAEPLENALSDGPAVPHSIQGRESGTGGAVAGHLVKSRTCREQASSHPRRRVPRPCSPVTTSLCLRKRGAEANSRAGSYDVTQGKCKTEAQLVLGKTEGGRRRDDRG